MATFISKTENLSIYKALCSETHNPITIVKIKKSASQAKSFFNNLKTLLTEKQLGLIKLLSVDSTNDCFIATFEPFESNLSELLRNNKVPADDVPNVIFSFLQQLKLVHDSKLAHKYVYPPNIIKSSNQFFLGSFMNFNLFENDKSFFLSSYRSPEVLLEMQEPNQSNDVWAAVCVLAELYLKKPIFEGKDELTVLAKITYLLGTPEKGEWDEGDKILRSKLEMPQKFESKLNLVIANLPSSVKSIIKQVFVWNPKKRPTVAVLLQNSLFNGLNKKSFNNQVFFKNRVSLSPQIKGKLTLPSLKLTGSPILANSPLSAVEGKKSFFSETNDKKALKPQQLRRFSTFNNPDLENRLDTVRSNLSNLLKKPSSFKNTKTKDLEGVAFRLESVESFSEESLDLAEELGLKNVKLPTIGKK